MTIQEYLAGLRGKRVTVIGIGVSNRPLLKLLLRAGAEVTARDKKTEDQLGPVADELRQQGAELILGEHYLENVRGDVVFRTPGLRPDHPALLEAQAQGAVLTSEMEVFFDVCPCTLIAVTGSDGKTTTTTLIAEMLRAAGKTVWLGGNIGTPLLDQTEKMAKDDFAVLELSSFQLMSMKKTPHIAVITNLSPNHLDVHHGMEEYIWAKCNIFRQQGKGDILVLNHDNDLTRALAKDAPGEVRFFGRLSSPEGGMILKDNVLTDGEQALFPAEEIRIPGVHNIENYMAACLALRGLVSPEIMEQTAKNFAGVEHRLELVRTLDGIRWYNDSIGSSPTRTIAGLRCFARKVILIAGGYDKKIPFDELGREAISHVSTLLLCGATADKIEQAVRSAEGFSEGAPEILRCETLAETVLKAQEIAKDGDIVLFSPACASFDQFPNFMVRGHFFKDRVNELQSKSDGKRGVSNLTLVEKIKKLSGTPGVSGDEFRVSKVVAEMLSEYCDRVETDDFGNVLGYRDCGIEGAKTVLLDAHIDQIGFLVTDITDEGFLRFVMVGGVDQRMLPGSELTVLTREGPILGVVAAMPPHLQKDGDDKKSIPIPEMVVDIGMTGEQAKKTVRIGDYMLFGIEAVELQGDAVCGKAMDDRSCIVCLLHALELLKDKELKVNIVFSASTKEETGFQGGISNAYRVQPDYAIAVDVTHARTADAPNVKSRLGDGADITLGSNSNPRLAMRMIEVARAKQIPHVVTSCAQGSGTNGWPMQLQGKGVMTLVVSLPLKYMHSPVEMLRMCDVESVGRLIASFLETFDGRL